MIVEEIIFVLGGSVKYLGPKVAEIDEWLSSGRVYCHTYFQMLVVMDAGRGLGVVIFNIKTVEWAGSW